MSCSSSKQYGDGILEWLDNYGLTLCRIGAGLPGDHVACLLSDYFGTTNPALKDFCLTQQLFTLGDLVELRHGQSHWWLPGELSHLSETLRFPPPPDAPALLVGQHWKLHSPCPPIKSADVVRIDGILDDQILVAWLKVYHHSNGLMVQYSGERLLLPRQLVFPTATVTRCTPLPYTGCLYQVVNCQETSARKGLTTRLAHAPMDPSLIQLILMGTSTLRTTMSWRVQP